MTAMFRCVPLARSDFDDFCFLATATSVFEMRHADQIALGSFSILVAINEPPELTGVIRNEQVGHLVEQQVVDHPLRSSSQPGGNLNDPGPKICIAKGRS